MTNLWLFSGPCPLECVHSVVNQWIHSGFSMEIGGLEWMGAVHGGIIVDTLPHVPYHS
jgi:hypothetical protein